MSWRARCPYRGCGYTGTEEEVDDHRTTHVHDDQPQAGSNEGSTRYGEERHGRNPVR
jgi:hypothetical protein